MSKIKIPNYTLKEELMNSITHGLGAILSIIALILCLIKSNNIFTTICISIYGFTLIILYIISCIYHALSPKTKGKKVLRVIDHCNVHALVLGTYLIIALCGIKGTLGIVMASIVAILSIIGIVLSAINVDKYSAVSVTCHLL